MNGYLGKAPPGTRLPEEGEELTKDLRKKNPGFETRADYMLHLARHKGASQVSPEKSSFLKSGCASYKILSQREVMSFPYLQPWLRFFHCK